MRRRRSLRAGSTVVAAAATMAVVVATGLDVDAWRVGALAALVCASAWLVDAALLEPGPTWRVPREPVAVVPPGSDERLNRYIGVLESHRTSTEPDHHVQEGLRRLVDRRLAQRGGLTTRDPMARELVGEELLAALEGPPRRLPSTVLDRFVRRIEEL